jgi:serine/threonine protein kinase
VSEERRNRAKSIVRSALTRKPEDRARFIREACAGDVTLIPEVESLLDSFERLESRLKASEADAGALGRKIGKYEVIERVGQGAMGVVYKARDPLMRRLVAIKTMSTEIASDPELRSRFLREAQSAGNLSHKNIITIHAMDEEGGRPYIAMEFLTGEDLKSKLDRRVRLTLEDRLRWMCEMCDGLDHAHGKEVIHRDIKPANVFITRDGDVKILDFGLARLVSSVATKSGLVMGTPSYMSPEQVRGDKHLDHRSDLFSAGSTFYELLSYRKPFAGDTIHGVFYKILESTPPALKELNPWLPDELVAIVEKTMAKDREVRYQGCGEVLRDLRRVEAALAERKRALRGQAVDALSKVSTRYRELQDRRAQMGIVGASFDSSTIVLTGADSSEAPTITDALPVDYLGLAAAIENARGDCKRLENELSKLESAARFFEQARVLEAKGRGEEALEKADEALRFCPGYFGAAELADRLSRALGNDPRFQHRRAQELAEEGEERLEEGALLAAGERFARLLALDPENRRAIELKRRLDAAIENERREREAIVRADRLVASAREKLAKDDDPSGCLALVGQALSLKADHSDARDLKEKAENRLAQQRSLAAEETAAEAIASATLAVKRGDLATAERELERASRQNPSATEIPALTLLLERARRASEATELVTQRESLPSPVTERAARQPPAVRSPRSAPRMAAPKSSPWPWLAGVGSLVAVVLAGALTWSILGTNARQAAPPDPPLTSTVPLETTVPATTTIPPTTVPQPTSTVAPESTSTIATTSSSSIASSSTTSVVPTTTTSAAPTTSVATTTLPVVVSLTPEEQIEDLMRKYEAAYESLDVASLGAIYPAVPLSVKTSFQNFKSLELEMSPIAAPEISRSTAGPTASAAYRIVQSVEPKVGKRTVSRHRASFLFAGVGSSWIIVRVDWTSE